MNFFGKTFGLLLASLALASCGGGGGNGGAVAPPVNSTMTLSATSTTLPVNLTGYLPSQYGNPTQATVTIDWHNPNGTLVTGQDIAVSISPPNIAALSCIIDGNVCTDADQLFAQFTITGTNGHATIFVNSYTTAGTATLTAAGVDPVTHANISASMVFTITSGVGPAPAHVSMVPSPAGVYLPSSGGINTSAITATVLDGAGQLVPDPVDGNSGVDNIQFDIVGNAGDATLSSNSVAGPVSGTSVKSHTVHGVAVASLQAGDGTPQGPLQIRGTVDRADNNVSNGIQDPVSSTVSVVISDGKLYSIELTTLVAPALPGSGPVNAVSPDVSSTGTQIPPDPDAPLSLQVGVIATDRWSNPVIPGTAIHFGSVDEPVGAPGTATDNQFLLSGFDGNPQEGGTTFTAPTGQFTTAGGGAGSGDALVVFGKAVEGNADLESAATVTAVNSATNLTVSPAFNLNDTTDVSVDSGAVLPYLIGRSMHGSITGAATTDADLAAGSPPTGIAHATLTYAVKNVGSTVAIWAQGSGVDTVTGGPRRVTDAGTMVYPGLAPATLAVTPLSIPGNSTQNVTLCVTDALGIPLRGVPVGFMFAFTNGGTGTVDGRATGTFEHLTGLDGCTIGVVTTTGVPGAATADQTAGTLNLSAAGQTTQVTITTPVTNTLTVTVDASSPADPVGPYTVSSSIGNVSPAPPPQSCTANVVTLGTPATQTCTFTFDQGAVVTLSETGAPDSVFAGWTGDCTNGIQQSTTVTITGDVSCTATW